MTTLSLDLDATIRGLHKALDFAMSVHSTDIARDKAAVAHFLARRAGTVAAKALEARAKAAVRFLEVSRYV